MNLTRRIDSSTATDPALIRRSRLGDQNAYGQIVERYQSLVCSVAYNRCGDLALSEDLAQDAFILAWQKLADLKDVSKFQAWICTIARNLASRSLHRVSRSVTGAAAPLDLAAEIPSDIETPVERAVSEEEEKLVWEALSDVPENYREPLILFYREGQSVARVAGALDLSEDAVKQRLSRGRKMLRQHLAAVVESALADSKPTKAFAGAVLLGLSSSTAKTATAAGATTAAASVASGAGAGGGLFSSLLLGPILNLPVIAWMWKVSFDETRSQRERQLLVRSLFVAVGGLVCFAAMLVSAAWWGQFIASPWLRGLLSPPALMFAFIIPWVVYCRRMGNQIERIRIEEGTFTPPRPLIESGDNGPVDSQVYRFFWFSSLLVVAGPAVLPLIAGDWLMLSVMLVGASGISLLAAGISIRFPKPSFQLFGVSTTLTALVVLGIVFWKQSSWASQFADIWPWFLGATSAAPVTAGILNVIAWRRVYGRPRSPGGRS